MNGSGESFWLLCIPTLAYLGIAIIRSWRGDWPTALVFAGYFAANCGFLLAWWRQS